MSNCGSTKRVQRRRLLLGGNQADDIGTSLTGRERELDRAMEALYDRGHDRRGAFKRFAPQPSHAGSEISACTSPLPSSA